MNRSFALESHFQTERGIRIWIQISKIKLAMATIIQVPLWSQFLPNLPQWAQCIFSFHLFTTACYTLWVLRL